MFVSFRMVLCETGMLSQHEIMNLRLFILCVKIRKYETFSIRSNSAMRNGP